ncbi:MAG: preprotein translocase subunit SecE [Eubacterium sp.]|nr:preprotein translocase subunit SecE [Eubacterium sp.]
MATAKNSNVQRRESVGEYLKGVRKEMGKVVWPTRKELGAYTVVVAATCAIFALGFWLVDLGVLALLKNILGVTMN